MTKYCKNCGYLGEPATVTKGHFAMELMLWLCFLVPGLIYSLWRLSSRYEACPKCDAPGMIPGDSPFAPKSKAPPDAIRASSPAAVSAGKRLGRLFAKAW